MLEGLEPPVKENLCVLMKKAADLDKKDLQILLNALDDPRWEGAALTAALAERGFHVNKGAIQEHRRKACRCAR